jgi:hypothetical protein
LISNVWQEPWITCHTLNVCTIFLKSARNTSIKFQVHFYNFSSLKFLLAQIIHHLLSWTEICCSLLLFISVPHEKTAIVRYHLLTQLGWKFSTRENLSRELFSLTSRQQLEAPFLTDRLKNIPGKMKVFAIFCILVAGVRSSTFNCETWLDF